MNNNSLLTKVEQNAAAIKGVLDHASQTLLQVLREAYLTMQVKQNTMVRIGKDQNSSNKEMLIFKRMRKTHNTYDKP
ncbi:hypothetical protein ACONDI_01311 [Natranaerofaba carboxydovora]|nr:hypothetical protein ACONDI_01311 [Natranaerofaba carboxydovora]